ncbi:hypothetical protein BDV19DRAFT_364616 [Aspergillus venezuelensis]
MSEARDIQVHGYARAGSVHGGGVYGVFVEQQKAQTIMNINYGDKDPLSSLFTYNLTAKEALLSEQVINGTGQWFFETDDFQRWESKKVETLWCPGEAGVGKSFIAYNVVKRLSLGPSGANAERRPRIAVLRVFFEGQGVVNDLFGNLIKQLADHVGHARQIVHKLAADLHKGGGTIIGALQRYLDAFNDQASEFERVFVIIDALDEWPVFAKHRSNMEEALRELAEIDKVSLMVTARRHIDPDQVLSASLFRNTRVIEIRAKPTDLRMYITAQLNAAPRVAQALSERRIGADKSRIWREKIITTVTDTAGDIFLLAFFYLQSILDCENLGILRKTLKKPPQTLSAAFQETWNRLGQQESRRDVQLAIQVLAWVSYAPRPMTNIELQYALLEGKELTIDIENETPMPTVVSACFGFVTYDGKSIRILHATAKKFLMNHFGKEVDRLRGMAQSCINYLATNRFKAPPCSSDEELNSRLETNGFLRYAACNWGHHLRFYEQSEQPRSDRSRGWAERTIFAIQRTVGRRLGFALPPTELVENEELETAALDMLLYPDRLQSFAQILYIPDFLSEGFSQRFPHDFTPLHVAAHFGCLGLGQRVLDRMQDRKDVNAQDSFKKTALHIAARKGHTKLVELLVNNNADIEISTDDDETPLLSAAALNETADVKVLELLIARGANVMAHNKPGGTGLHWAALTGRTEVVELLLEHDADYADVADPGKTVNYIQESPDIMVTLLLDKLALAGVKNLVGGTPLHWGSFNGRVEVVRLLLDKAGQVNRTDLSKREFINKPNLLGGTALHGAAWNGNDELVEELLKQGADLSVKTVLGSTPLREACLSGNVAVARILLENGADPDAEPELMGSSGSRDPAMPTRDDPRFVDWLVARGKQVAESDTADGKRTLNVVVEKMAPDPFMAMLASAALENAINNRDDQASALRAANAKGFEALTSLLRSINKTTR